MPFLQFISGGRDQEFEELNPAASLVVGSGAEAHIRCSDPGVEAKHCTVYPAQGKFWLQDLGSGSTVFKMKRLASGTEGLVPGDVFIVGTTYVKFWEEKPAATGGGGASAGGGADPAELAKAQEELKAAQAELEQLKTAGAGQGDKLAEVEASLADAQAKAESASSELESTQASLEEAQGKVTQLEADLEAAKADSESAVAAAQEQAAADKAEVESALDAARTALAALEARAASAPADTLTAAGSDSDLEAALAALGLPDALADRLRAAVTAEIDRGVLSRLEGPVVPLRGFRIPGSDRDLESELRAIQRRGEQVSAARDAGLATLEAEELERLLSLARS